MEMDSATTFWMFIGTLWFWILSLGLINTIRNKYLAKIQKYFFDPFIIPVIISAYTIFLWLPWYRTTFYYH